MEYYEAIEKGEEYLSHHGVKGMRWGIRHDPERVGRVKRAIAKVGRKTIRGLRRAGRASYRAARNASYNHTQRKIERAISSGNADKVNKLFSKMNDQQVSRAVNRVNQKDSLYRSKVEAGRRSVKNAKLQRRLETINLRNQIRQQSHPALSKVGSKLGDDFTNTLSKTMTKELGREIDYALLNKMHGSGSVNGLKLTKDEIKKISGFSGGKLKRPTVKKATRKNR